MLKRIGKEKYVKKGKREQWWVNVRMSDEGYQVKSDIYCTRCLVPNS